MIWNARHHSHVKVSILRPYGMHIDVLVPRQRVRNLVLVPRNWNPASKTRPSRELLFFRRQLEASVPVHKPGEWKYESKMSSVTTTILNLLFAEAEQKGKTRNVRTYIGPGSGGSSADKLSLDLKFNIWDNCDYFSTCMALNERDSLYAA